MGPVQGEILMVKCIVQVLSDYFVGSTAVHHSVVSVLSERYNGLGIWCYRITSASGVELSPCPYDNLTDKLVMRFK